MPEILLIVDRIRKKGLLLNTNDLSFAKEIAKGLTAEPLLDEIEQEERVLDNLENIYHIEAEKGEHDEGEMKFRGYRTKSGKDKGYTEIEPSTHAALRAQKHWEEERETFKGRGSVVYVILLIPILFFFIIMLLIRRRENLDLPEKDVHRGAL